MYIYRITETSTSISINSEEKSMTINQENRIKS